MKRAMVVSSIVLIAVLAVVGTIAVGIADRGVGAQDVSTEDHPLVGTWIADTEPDVPDNIPEPFVFHADGTYTQVSPDGTAAVGVWEATGDATATLTIAIFEGDEEGPFTGSFTIRASIEVAEDGNSFTAEYTFEITDAAGNASGQAGPGTVVATRLMVEAPGTPVMTFDELFSGFEGEEAATPEATPAG